MTSAEHKSSVAPTRDSAARPARDARRAAYDALVAVQQRPVFVTRALEDQFGSARFSRADRGFATELAIGVVRRRLTLDTLLLPHLRRPLEEIEPGLRTLLRLGVYQLVLIDVPVHAAVHETVELARRIGKPRWVGFVNGVLRSVRRDLTDAYGPGPAANMVPVVRLLPSPAAVPEVEARYRELRSPCFTDPREDEAGYLSQGFSMPRWLVERWLSGTPSAEVLRRCAWFDTPGRMSLRVNLLRCERERLLEILHASAIDAAAGGLPELVNLAGTARVEDIPGFAEGWFSVQDESAIQAGILLDPRPGERILDLCAAPGGKTTHLAERMGDTGELIATDTASERLARVEESARRLGLTSIETHTIREDGSDLPAGPFDAVLVDVPCSNTGVLGKRPEARWRVSAEGICELARLQQRLLRTAIDHLGPSGRVVYSTCSIEAEENERVVRQVLADHPQLQVVNERRHLPGSPADGGYQALLRKA